jgi:hypothetical protein
MATTESDRANDLADIRTDIEIVLQPWRRTGQTPIFTVLQMVAMALIFSDGPLTPQDVFVWIIRTFPCYCEEALISAWGNTFSYDADFASISRPSRPRKFPQLIRDLTDTLLNFNFGFDTIFQENEGPRFTISLGAATRALAPLLTWRGPKTQKPFPFFELPAELCNII